MSKFFNRQARLKLSAQQLYGSIVAQARDPGFYGDFGVQDTPAGRFEMICLHLFIILEVLRRKNADDQTFSRILIETFFSDMDGALREMGVGDLSVPKQVRKMAEAFYSRLHTYTKVVEMPDPKALARALERNILAYGDSPATEGASLEREQFAAYLSNYTIKALDGLCQCSAEDLQNNSFEFPAFTETAGTRCE